MAAWTWLVCPVLQSPQGHDAASGHSKRTLGWDRVQFLLGSDSSCTLTSQSLHMKLTLYLLDLSIEFLEKFCAPTMSFKDLDICPLATSNLAWEVEQTWRHTCYWVTCLWGSVLLTSHEMQIISHLSRWRHQSLERFDDLFQDLEWQNLPPDLEVGNPQACTLRSPPSMVTWFQMHVSWLSSPGFERSLLLLLVWMLQKVVQNVSFLFSFPFKTEHTPSYSLEDTSHNAQSKF